MRPKELEVPKQGPVPDGVIIRALRYHKGLSSEDLGRAIGRSSALITQVETGAMPSRSLLDRLSGVFGKPAEELRNTDREQLAKWLESPPKPTYKKGVQTNGAGGIINFPPRDRINNFDWRVQPKDPELQPIPGIEPPTPIPGADILNKATGQMGKIVRDGTGQLAKDEEGLLTIEFPNGLRVKTPESLLGKDKKYQPTEDSNNKTVS